MKKALLLIDIQNDYFPGGKMELCGMEEASVNAAALLGFFRERRMPVLFVRHLAADPGAAFFLPGTPGAEIHASVAPLPGEKVVEKHFPNAFRETDLFETLKKLGAGEIVVCGAMTHMCIDATTRAAFDLGFRCVVAEDACATKNLEHRGVAVKAWKVHASFIAALGAVYAEVVTAAEFLGRES